MLEFKRIDVEAMPYLYEEHRCRLDPVEMSTHMGEAFQNVLGFIQSHGLTPTGAPLSVYYSYDPEEIVFRAGFPVSAEDAQKAEGTIQAAETPAGNVLSFYHLGPYEGLRESYGVMMQYLEANGLTLGAPTWEVYVNSPDEVPAADLRTDIFVSLA